MIYYYYYVNSESDIELLYFTLIKNALLNIYTEYLVNGGYADVYIFVRVKLKYNILIEIKYIKKSDFSKGLFKSKREKAIERLNKNSLDEIIKSDKLVKYVVIFEGNEVKLLENI